MSEALTVVHVVDDDASFLVALARLLKASGYTVQTHASAADFLVRMGDGAGCVVTDLRMPGMNGLDLQQALKRGANVLPVVFLTGEGDIPTTVQKAPTCTRCGRDSIPSRAASWVCCGTSSTAGSTSRSRPTWVSASEQ